MADFKFFAKNEEDEFERILNETFPLADGELPNPVPLTDAPAVYLRLERNRDTISQQEWTHLLRQQRQLLIERMWEQDMIRHTVISQDDNGFTLRTEVRSDILF
jgi:hypothetical protein